MLDLLFVGMIVAFFVVALLLVKLCDRIIGPSDVGSVTDEAPVEVSA